MTVEVALVISFISLSLGIYKGISTMKRNERNEGKADATEMTTVIVKLESIGNGISEIKSEMKNVKSDIKENRERIIKTEESSKQAHKRLDRCEKFCKPNIDVKV